MIQDNIVTMGALIAVVILAGRTLAPLTQLAQALTRVNTARATFKTINELMKKPRIEMIMIIPQSPKFKRRDRI